VADVFLSYAQEDLRVVKRLGAALEKHGWTVWFDQHIEPGRVFRDDIRKQIESAAAVVVLWSEHSVKKMWVKAEASLAGELDVLVPARIGECMLPLPFNEVQAASLVGWDGDDTPGYVQLVVAIAKRVAVRPRAPSAGGAELLIDAHALEKAAAMRYRGLGKRGWQTPVLRTTATATGTLLTWLPVVGATDYVLERAATKDFKNAEQIPCGGDLWFAPFEVPKDGLQLVSPAPLWRPTFYYRLKAAGDGLESDWSEAVKVP
jgi:hypothetical protein